MIWTNWKPLPTPETCRTIEGPKGPGVYQVRNKKTNELIQFGESINCQKRMKSFFPAPHMEVAPGITLIKGNISYKIEKTWNIELVLQEQKRRQ